MRKTNYIVYVDKSELDEPDSLCDAVMCHLIKKEYPIQERKRFLAQFMKAPTDAQKMKVIDEWAQIRDAATFPFRNEPNKGKGDADKVI